MPNNLRQYEIIEKHQNIHHDILSYEIIEKHRNLLYEILLSGKKRYLKATVGDIIFSLLVPFWGVVIGCFALLRGEKKRGQTMMQIGIAWLTMYMAIKISLIFSLMSVL